MSRRRRKKKPEQVQNEIKDKIGTVPPHDDFKTDEKKDFEKIKVEYEIEFVPLVFDPESGNLENIHLFFEILPVLEETSHIFGDDSMPKVENYKEWLDYCLGFIQSIQPWMYVAVVNGKAQGFFWAANWAGNGPQVHSVTISGGSQRKTPIEVTTQALNQFIAMIFTNTPVYIIRGEYTEDNRAAGLALTRAGLSHKEYQRATMIRGGQEITGIIKSITRPEWEETLHG